MLFHVRLCVKCMNFVCTEFRDDLNSTMAPGGFSAAMLCAQVGERRNMCLWMGVLCVVV